MLPFLLNINDTWYMDFLRFGSNEFNIYMPLFYFGLFLVFMYLQYKIYDRYWIVHFFMAISGSFLAWLSIGVWNELFNDYMTAIVVVVMYICYMILMACLKTASAFGFLNLKKN